MRISILFLLMVTAAFAEVNLATAQYGFLLDCGDSIPNYANQAGSAFDGKPETAWVSGDMENIHWMRCHWYRGDVELHGVEMDFTPIEYNYWTHAQLFRKETSRKVDGRTARPSVMELNVEFSDGKSKSFCLNIDENLFGHKFEKPLMGVSAVVIHIKGDGPVSVREMKLSGAKPSSCDAFKPQFSNIGGYWIWGEPKPANPSEKLTVWNFRRIFDLPHEEVDCAILTCAAYSKGVFFLNGEKIAETAETTYGLLPRAERYSISADRFCSGRNLIAATGTKIDYAMGTQGIIYQLAIRMKNGKTIFIGSDAETVFSDTTPEGWNSVLDACADWKKAKPLHGGGGYGNSLWGLDYSLPFFKDRIQLTSVTLEPAQPKSGGEYSISVSFKADKPLADNYGVIAEFGELPISFTTDENLSLGEAFLPPANGLNKGFVGECTLKLSGRWPRGTGRRVPMRLTLCNGKAQAEIVSDIDGAETSMPGKMRLMLGGDDVKLTATDFPDAKVSGGRVWLDGQMVVPICYASSLLTPDRMSDFVASESVRIFRVPSGVALIDSSDDPAGSFNRAFLDVLRNCVMTALRMNPDAKFLVNVSLNLPNDWIFAHEDSQFERGDGSRQVALTGTRVYTFLRESVASEEVHENISRSVRRFIQELRRQPYANSIIGIVLSQGRAGENTWGLDINVGKQDGRTIVRDRDTMLIGDMSLGCRRAFVKWLRNKYGTDKRWREAWRLPEERIIEEIADKSVWTNDCILSELVWRNRPDDKFIFRDAKAEGRLAADYFEFFNLQRAHLFLAAARAIKEASDGRLIVGGYAGYTLPNSTNSPPGSAQHNGHQMVSVLRESDCFDFVCSPHFYHNRRMGDPVMPFCTVDSMRLNGKTVINEFDTRTFLSPIPPKTFSRFESLHQMRKEFSYALIKGQGYWLLEFPRGTAGAQGAAWFSDSEIQRELAIGMREYLRYLDMAIAKCVAHNGTSRELEAIGTGAEIAVFLSETAPFFTDVHAPANTVASNLVNVLLPKFSLTGAPFDLYSLEDLNKTIEKGIYKQYKLMVFLNAYKIDSKTRVLISKRLKQDGRTLLFLFAPGLLGGEFDKDHSLSLKGIEDVTGIAPVDVMHRSALIGMEIPSGAFAGVPPMSHDAIGWWEQLQIEFYKNEIGPVFYMRPDSSWKTIAALRMDGKVMSDKVAVAMKETSNCRVIYSTVPDIPDELLNAIIGEAGVHRYVPRGVLVYANRHYLCVNNDTTAKTVPLILPNKAKWFDVFDGKCVAESVDSLSVEMKPGETRLFRLE